VKNLSPNCIICYLEVYVDGTVIPCIGAPCDVNTVGSTSTERSMSSKLICYATSHVHDMW
jgi:hypothetical protein